MSNRKQTLTRRELLALGGAALAMTPTRVGAQMGGGGMGGGGTGGGGMNTVTSPPSTPFVRALALPRVVTPGVAVDPMTGASADLFEVTAREDVQEILPGYWTPVFGYDGEMPGPAIVARSGRTAILRLHNNLPEPTVVHLHGGHIPVEHDGHAMDHVMPGMIRDYIYPNNQMASTIWYHDHTMDMTAPHVWKGLAAPYVITDAFEDALPLPKGAQDVPLIIQDRVFNADGTFNYTLTTQSLRRGMHGDVAIVNGVAQPFFKVGTRTYRFRIVNGCNARLLQLALSNGQSFVQIGGDGGLLPAPVTRSSLLISPGERVEVVVDFSKYSVGTKIVLRNTLGAGRTYDVMRFDVAWKERDDTSVPAVLRPIERLDPAMAVQTRQFVLGMTMDGKFTINGLSYDHMHVEASPKLNTIEIWEFINPMGMWHCMHPHAIMWQILDRNGVAPPAYERGWKDTWYMPGNSRVRVIGHFTDYACDPDPMAHLSNYMIHCHILEHEDQGGMMTQFKVVDGTPMPM
jgi:spore coat protein A